MLKLLDSMLARKPAPARPPEETFKLAIGGRQNAYARLRKVMAEALYMRSRQDGELFEIRAALARAIAAPDAHTLVGGRRVAVLEEQLREAERDRRWLKDEVARLTEALSAAQESIAELERERRRARLVLQTERLRDSNHGIVDDLLEAELEEARRQVARSCAERALESELAVYHGG